MSYLIAGVLGVALCLMLVYTIFDNRKRRRRINLSGPQTWPFVGNLLQLDFNRPDITMEEWGKKHNGLYRMRVFSTDIVVATSYDAVYEILVSKGKSFAGRGKPFRRMVITYGGKDMIIGKQY
jgi:cytochrome P450 family 2 subfamily D